MILKRFTFDITEIRAHKTLPRSSKRTQGMPWSPAQHRLFEAAAHSPAVAQRVGIPQQKASQMASEGIKKKGQMMAEKLKK